MAPPIITQELVAEKWAVSAQTEINSKIPKIDPSSGPARGRDEATDPMPSSTNSLEPSPNLVPSEVPASGATRMSHEGS